MHFLFHFLRKNPPPSLTVLLQEHCGQQRLIRGVGGGRDTGHTWAIPLPWPLNPSLARVPVSPCHTVNVLPDANFALQSVTRVAGGLIGWSNSPNQRCHNFSGKLNVMWDQALTTTFKTHSGGILRFRNEQRFDKLASSSCGEDFSKLFLLTISGVYIPVLRRCVFK